MPPLVAGHLRRLSEVLQETARLVAGLGALQATEQYPAHAHTEAEEVATCFQRINETLKAAVKDGHLTADQQRSIAENVEAAARAIEKAAGSAR